MRLPRSALCHSQHTPEGVLTFSAELNSALNVSAALRLGFQSMDACKSLTLLYCAKA